MSDDQKNGDGGYIVSVKSRGGSGRAATWLWEVREADKTLPVEKGVLQGPESKAHEAGRDAIARLTKRQADKAKKIQK
jgi:hypothetical protein